MYKKISFNCIVKIAHNINIIYFTTRLESNLPEHTTTHITHIHSPHHVNLFTHPIYIYILTKKPKLHSVYVYLTYQALLSMILFFWS